MAKENVKKFIEMIQDKPQEQKLMFNILIKQGTGEDMEKMLAHAKEAGVPFTEEDFLAETSIMDEEELDMVAGGTAAEYDAIFDLLYKKGYIEKPVSVTNFFRSRKTIHGGDPIPGGVKTVLRALGIVSVRWNNSVLPCFDKPAVFTGQDGKRYSFNDVYNAIKQLSDWR
ncbi:Nif11 family protein [Anaerovibrio sp. RM50]|uniref:Nif11 family protein n=1 Tax=Anaerovibrio sp. RM50 TaxID=1200557 RepID=UPI0004830535|nr:Nif11 family protein [Anaerovibrio sp. RM50]